MSKRWIRFELEKSDVLLVVGAVKERSEKLLEDIRTMDEMIHLNIPHRTEEETQRSRGVRDRKVRDFDRCQALIATIEEQTL